MRQRSRERLLELALLAAVAAWALNFTAVRYGVTHGFSPLVYGSLRYAGAGACLMVLAQRQEGGVHVSRRDLIALSVIAAIGVALNQLSFVYAVRLASASTVALVFGTAPVLIAFFARVTRGAKLGSRGWIAAGFSCGGVALVAAGERGTLSGGLGGILLALCATVTWAVFTVAIGPIVRRYSALRVNAIVTGLGSLGLLAAAAPQLREQQWDQIGGLGWLSFAYSALVAYLIASTIWLVAIDHLGAARAAVYANLEPFLGAMFAVIILSEPLTTVELAGGCAIALSILLSRRTTGGKAIVPQSTSR